MRWGCCVICVEIVMCVCVFLCVRNSVHHLSITGARKPTTNWHIPHLRQRRISEMHQKIHQLRHEIYHSRYDRGQYNPTNNSLLQKTQLQLRMASRACRVMAGGYAAMDDARCSECSGGWTSGTSMRGRLQSNTAPPNRPTLSPLQRDTNDTPRWISIGKFGVDCI